MGRKSVFLPHVFVQTHYHCISRHTTLNYLIIKIIPKSQRTAITTLKKKKQQKTPTQMAGLKPLLVFNKQGNLLGFSKCLEIRTQGHPSGHTGIITLNSWHVPSRFLQGSKGKHIRCGNQLTTFLQYATLPIIGFAHVFNIFYSLRMKSVFTCSLRAAQRQGQQQKETSLSLPQELPTSTGGQKHPQSNTYLLALSLEAGRRYQPGPSGIAGQGRGEGS